MHNKKKSLYLKMSHRHIEMNRKKHLTMNCSKQMNHGKYLIMNRKKHLIMNHRYLEKINIEND